MVAGREAHEDMKTSIIRIGNSQGIRIPKTLLERCRLKGEVDLEVRGTCALLIAAKARGLITQERPILETMRGGGYFIGTELMAECLRRAGE